MKKTTCIQLVLITAALAGCERTFYLQQPTYQDRGYLEGRGDQPDSTNSCPLLQSALPPDYYLWYSGLRPFDFYFGEGFGLQGYYNYRCPVRIVRAGFGRIAFGRVGGGVHS
jgi:hypothetical protein